MPDTQSAKKRRNLFQPHLSDRSIKKIQPVLEQSIKQFSRIIQKASDEKIGVDLSLGYRSVTIDMLLRFGFGKTLRSLDDGSFNCQVAEDMDNVLFGSLIAKHFPNVRKAMFEMLLRLPQAIAKMVKVSSILEMRKDCYRMLREMIEKPKVEDISYPRIFDTAVKELISGRQLFIDELTAEAVVLLFAGGEATAISVIIGTFYLLGDPKRLHALKQELLSAMPDGQSVTLSEIERLPYLRGLVNEALRFTQGAPGRLPRVVRSEGATWCGESIPGKTIVSSSHYVYHFDPDIFDHPFSFKPERWLDEPNAQRLDK
ncbi:cytochrome P450 [Aspergillus floccosus]